MRPSPFPSENGRLYKEWPPSICPSQPQDPPSLRLLVSPLPMTSLTATGHLRHSSLDQTCSIQSNNSPHLAMSLPAYSPFAYAHAGPLHSVLSTLQSNISMRTSMTLPSSSFQPLWACLCTVPLRARSLLSSQHANCECMHSIRTSVKPLV